MTTQSNPMDGKNYLRALSYALAAVPTDDERSALQHVTFIGNRVVGSDGVRRHDGYLPDEIPEPISVVRISAKILLDGLEFAHKFSKQKGGSFSVTHVGSKVKIDYGNELPLVYPLDVAEVGGHPDDLHEWVRPDAPVNPEGHLDNDCLRAAVSWWRSWEKDKGSSQIRGGMDGGPIRLDITSGGRRVATAFVLPMDHPPAEFRDTLPLFDGVAACGKSNLDLDLSGDGAPPSTEAGSQQEELDAVEQEGAARHARKRRGKKDPEAQTTLGDAGASAETH